VLLDLEDDRNYRHFGQKTPDLASVQGVESGLKVFEKDRGEERSKAWHNAGYAEKS
jgi:hypothetical protein